MCKLPSSLLTVLLAIISISTLSLLYGSGIKGPSEKQAGGKTISPEYQTDKIVIKFRNAQTFGARLSKTGVSSVDALLAANNVSRLERVSKRPLNLLRRSTSIAIENIYYAHFSGETSPDEIAATFRHHPLVEYAEPLRIYRLDAIPNDPLFSVQRNLEIVEAQAAWDIVKGEQGNVVVAVVDGGTDVDHNDLAANVWINPGESGNGRETNARDDDNNGFVDDVRGWNFADDSNDPTGLASTPTNANHGTHVAGIIGAVTDNGNQVSGVSWNARVMAINAAFGQVDNAIAFGYDGVLYAADNGADIVNLSWGGGGAASIFEQDVINYATDLGVVVIAAAGNDNTAANHYPASYEHVFSVASTNNNDVRSSFSNFGRTLDISAPGENVRNTFNNHLDGAFSGTSQASPLVAGVVALVRTLRPNLLGVQAVEQVRVTSDNIDVNNPGLVGQLGNGRVNARRAVSVSDLPSIRIANVSFIDANQNNVIQPGESVELRIDFINYLSPATAINLTITEDDPFVLLTNASGSVASLGTLQTTSTPVSFSFNVTEAAPNGRLIDFDLQINSGEYSDRDRFSLIVQPTFGTTNVNNIAVSLTSIGRIGFANTETSPPVDGIGFTFKNGPNLLFEGALIAGTGPARISNAARGLISVGSSSHTIDKDFATATDGELRIITPGAIADQESFATFEDSEADNPMNLRISQESFAINAAPYQDFVLLRFTVQNQGQEALSNLHFGLFFDWDLGSTQTALLQNLATYDGQRRMGIVSHQSTFVGVASMGSTNLHYRAIDNNEINDANGFTDSEKWQAISGGLAVIATGPADVSQVVANGPFTIGPTETVTLDYALLAANSVAELQATADSAIALWVRQFAGDEPPPPVLPAAFALFQNYPNPFNGNTEIRYDLPEPADVELTIFNVLGQEVRKLLQARQEAQEHHIQWDGKNDAGEPVATGIYLYELRAGNFSQVRKMAYVR
jgi:subtilisin family serine protease